MENISDKIVALNKFLFKIRITVYQKEKNCRWSGLIIMFVRIIQGPL